jgi:hypothetical protein
MCEERRPPVGVPGPLDPEAPSVRYGVEFDMDSVPRPCGEHGLVHPLLG